MALEEVSLDFIYLSDATLRLLEPELRRLASEHGWADQRLDDELTLLANRWRARLQCIDEESAVS